MTAEELISKTQKANNSLNRMFIDGDLPLRYPDGIRIFEFDLLKAINNLTIAVALCAKKDGK